MIVKETDYLAHYGVLGMKWGIRKDRYKNVHATGVSLRKGDIVQNISANHKRDLSKKDVAYITYTNRDNKRYASMYAFERMVAFGDESVYKNALVVNKNINIPSQKEAVDIFMEIAKNHRKELGESVAKAYVDLCRVTENVSDISAQRCHDAIFKDFQKKGEKWLQTTGYATFNQVLTSDKGFRLKSLYIQTLLAKGYGGVFDVNDINGNFNSTAPLIIFNPESALSVKNAVKLSISDIHVGLASLLETTKDRDDVEWLTLAKRYLEKHYKI